MSSSTPTASSSTSASTPKVKLASSSLLALKAEITRKTATTLGSSSYTRGLPSSTDGPKPISPWHRSNPGLAARQAKDQIVYEAELDQTGRINTVRSNLEQKARLYERIKKGKDLGVDNHKVSQLLVDFEAKEEQTDSEGETDSSEEQEDSDQAQAEDDPRNPMVEYLDEFGRSHRVPRSDVPAGTALPANVSAQASPSDKVYYGDQRHFPVYEPDRGELARDDRRNCSGHDLVRFAGGVSDYPPDTGGIGHTSSPPFNSNACSSPLGIICSSTDHWLDSSASRKGSLCGWRATRWVRRCESWNGTVGRESRVWHGRPSSSRAVRTEAK